MRFSSRFAASSPSCCSAIFSPHPLPPPARPPLPSTTSFHGKPISGGRSGRHSWKGRSACCFLQAGRGGGVPGRRLNSAVGAPGWRCGCGERRRLMLLLSERRNRQWDRSPSSACTSLLGAGSAPLSFENGGLRTPLKCAVTSL